MLQIKLNKASLSLELKNLKNYQRFLPSLELKRKKLLSERNRVDAQINELTQKKQTLEKNIQNDLPMIVSSMNIISQFIQIKKISLTEENIVGVKLPILHAIIFNPTNYVFFNTPQWFEKLIDLLYEKIELQLRLQVATKRQLLLAKAIQTVTQRKNLFEKVLIPRALNNIRLIQIFLADNERAAVVRSKIAKKKGYRNEYCRLQKSKYSWTSPR
ncbi:V-type ATP synthase subunit D [Legionella longbeachae]|uniref:Putative V-type ATP synthase, subunit d n=1 Tax=Legionella longbeachae serogroup 1 (strain NSW150) TaxID=661367 RepID=D3HP31_LEGLN|nr:V-type ATP synthase subunit D [Legionella longbeachae]VEE01171.1 V-type ATP synthase subunit D [Legionella oakridgensis]HBD7398388.1 V-type ATP synthase subunit D [Legionella pneumophila]ARB92455.1 V-type ATP synthase subunit D [Legionella longbeachae]ARM34365.1 V-type ATP synthase subunit D [Legionella longbeachae]EEZ96353.1 V-type ATP synthase subunit D [Legionella longbeachae D-4968]